MYTCIILHNMILKDQKFAINDFNELYVNAHSHIQRRWIERCETHRGKSKKYEIKMYTNNFTKILWSMFGNKFNNNKISLSII